MGNAACQDVKANVLSNLPTLGLGKSEDLAAGCGPAGSANLYVGCPQNGEFIADGEGGNCYYNGAKPGTEIACSSGCRDENGNCAIAGKRIRCKRVAYKGDPTRCCLSGAQTDGNTTCDPAYNSVSNVGCQEAMKSYCSSGSNFFTDSKCRDWWTANPAAADSTLITQCSAPKNATRPECSCIQEDIKFRDAGLHITFPSTCVSAKCVGPNVMKTQQQLKTNCNITYCDISQNQFNTIKSKIGGSINLTQNCSSQIANNNTSNGYILPVVDKVTRNNLILFGTVGVGSFVILLIIVVAMILLFKKK